MWTLIKTETAYNAGLFILIVLINISFTVLGIFRIDIFPADTFLEKHFWTIVISVGCYFIIFIYWTLRTVEKRDRLYALLPFTNHQIKLTRFLTGAAPFLIIAFWIELNRFILPEEWHKYIERVNVQLSMLFIFISIFSIAMELHLRTYQGLKGNNFINAVVVLVITAASISIFALDGSSYLPQMGALGGRVYFYLWGLITSYIAAKVFSSRISFTD